MEKIWMILAAVGVVCASVFLWFGNYDGTFVAAVLGCVSWFLSYRAKIKTNNS